LIFAVDIVVNFFSSYFDKEDNLIYDKKTIALNYMKGWFLIDVVSILPF